MCSIASDASAGWRKKKAQILELHIVIVPFCQPTVTVLYLHLKAVANY